VLGRWMPRWGRSNNEPAGARRDSCWGWPRDSSRVGILRWPRRDSTPGPTECGRPLGGGSHLGEMGGHIPVVAISWMRPLRRTPIEMLGVSSVQSHGALLSLSDVDCARAVLGYSVPSGATSPLRQLGRRGPTSDENCMAVRRHHRPLHHCDWWIEMANGVTIPSAAWLGDVHTARLRPHGACSESVRSRLVT
jgi:hypothetical protein